MAFVACLDPDSQSMLIEGETGKESYMYIDDGKAALWYKPKDKEG